MYAYRKSYVCTGTCVRVEARSPAAASARAERQRSRSPAAARARALHGTRPRQPVREVQRQCWPAAACARALRSTRRRQAERRRSPAVACARGGLVPQRLAPLDQQAAAAPVATAGPWVLPCGGWLLHRARVAPVESASGVAATGLLFLLLPLSMSKSGSFVLARESVNCCLLFMYMSMSRI
jgi:hypothetical protein